MRRQTVLQLMSVRSSIPDQPHQMANFEWAQRRSDQLSKWLSICMAVLATLFAIAPVAWAVGLRASGSGRPIRLALDVTMPFDIGTPLGYLLGVCWQFAFVISGGLHNLTGELVFVGGCLFAMAHVHDLRDFYRHLDAEYARTADQRRLRRHLIEAVRRHLTFVRWFGHLVHIGSGFIFFEIGACALTASASIFLFQVSAPPLLEAVLDRFECRRARCCTC